MTTLHDARPGADVTWSLVEDGFHVGSRDGEFVGYIDRKIDGYLACDMYSQKIGVFADLDAAMAAVLAAPPMNQPARRLRGLR